MGYISRKFSLCMCMKKHVGDVDVIIGSLCSIIDPIYDLYFNEVIRLYIGMYLNTW